MAEIPSADFSPSVATAQPWSRVQSSTVPGWWVHAFYHVVLPFRGWQFNSAQGEHEDRYCRPGFCLAIDTLTGSPGYFIVILPVGPDP
jgi:hypothetical protein